MRLAILGVGLVGGSIALGLRQRGWRFEGEGYTGDLPSFNLREAAERTNLEWEFIVGQRAVENGDGAQPGVATTATTATGTTTSTATAAATWGRIGRRIVTTTAATTAANQGQ